MPPLFHLLHPEIASAPPSSVTDVSITGRLLFYLLHPQSASAPPFRSLKTHIFCLLASPGPPGTWARRHLFVCACFLPFSAPPLHPFFFLKKKCIAICLFFGTALLPKLAQRNLDWTGRLWVSAFPCAPATMRRDLSVCTQEMSAANAMPPPRNPYKCSRLGTHSCTYNRPSTHQRTTGPLFPLTRALVGS